MKRLSKDQILVVFFSMVMLVVLFWEQKNTRMFLDESISIKRYDKTLDSLNKFSDKVNILLASNVTLGERPYFFFKKKVVKVEKKKKEEKKKYVPRKYEWRQYVVPLESVTLSLIAGDKATFRSGKKIVHVANGDKFVCGVLYKRKYDLGKSVFFDKEVELGDYRGEVISMDKRNVYVKIKNKKALHFSLNKKVKTISLRQVPIVGGARNSENSGSNSRSGRGRRGR